jgi:Double zinc ribbon
MRCSKCAHENRTGAKYCEECGAHLASMCANCGAQLSPAAKFCSECSHPAGTAALSTSSSSPRFGAPETYTPTHLAEKILTSKAALEGERKQVTVLFGRPTASPNPSAVHASQARLIGAESGQPILTHLALAREDLSAASMKRTPSTPSSTPGTRVAAGSGERPSRRAAISSARSAQS